MNRSLCFSRACICMLVAAALWAVARFSAPLKAQPLDKIVNTSCVTPPEGLVAWWRAEGDARDAVAGQIPERNGVAYQAGHTGQAFLFNSAASYLKVPASDRLDVGKGSGFTLELWINPSTDEPNHPLLEWHDAQTTVGVHLWIHDVAGRIWANIMDTEDNHHVITTGPGVVLPRVWQHIALTYDKNGSASIYRNGVLVARQDIGSFTPRTSSDLYFGVRYSEKNKYYMGMMDEVSLYNRALSRAEIEALHGAGTAGKCADKIKPPQVSDTTALGSAESPPGANTSGALAPFSGECVDVFSGDTIGVNQGSETRLVRLYGIDAPQQAQIHGKAATEYLRRLLRGKNVKVFPQSVDPASASGWVLSAVLRQTAKWCRMATPGGINCMRRTKPSSEIFSRRHVLQSGAVGRANPVAPWEWVKLPPEPAPWIVCCSVTGNSSFVAPKVPPTASSVQHHNTQ
jgi:hypothetical protein